MRIDVRKSYVDASHCHGTVIVHANCLECVPALGRGGRCTNTRVIPLLADCIWPVDIDNAGKWVL